MNARGERGKTNLTGTTACWETQRGGEEIQAIAAGAVRRADELVSRERAVAAAALQTKAQALRRGATVPSTGQPPENNAQPKRF